MKRYSQLISKQGVQHYIILNLQQANEKIEAAKLIIR